MTEKPTKVVPVFFDLETQGDFKEVNYNFSKLRYSVAVVRENKVNHVYYEKDSEKLLDHLDRADLIVGHNHIKFDYTVLQYYGVTEADEIQWRVKSYDVLVEIFRIVKNRISLDHLSKQNVSGAPGKLFDGAQCPILYKEAIAAYEAGKEEEWGTKMQKLVDLCTDDVERLAKIFGLIIGGQKLTISKYWDKSFRKIQVQLPIPEGVTIG